MRLNFGAAFAFGAFDKWSGGMLHLPSRVKLTPTPRLCGWTGVCARTEEGVCVCVWWGMGLSFEAQLWGGGSRGGPKQVWGDATDSGHRA